MLLAVVVFYGGYVLSKLLKLSKFFFLVGSLRNLMNLRNLGSLGKVFHQQSPSFTHHATPPYIAPSHIA